ncbi:MAG: hypothetical protein NTY55_04360 [Flavobacteriia bacterium]|nr:hypothetical protein [Flavobacteriia bacterium]
MKKGISLIFLLFVLLTLTNCKKEESILKVFVRSASNQLINGAKVIVIGDQQSTPPTGAFVDTVFTNSSGFSTISMDNYFASTDNTTGYFDIIVKYNSKVGIGYSRCRVHSTSVETVYLEN